MNIEEYVPNATPNVITALKLLKFSPPKIHKARQATKVVKNVINVLDNVSLMLLLITLGVR